MKVSDRSFEQDAAHSCDLIFGCQNISQIIWRNRPLLQSEVGGTGEEDGSTKGSRPPSLPRKREQDQNAHKGEQNGRGQPEVFGRDYVADVQQAHQQERPFHMGGFPIRTSRACASVRQSKEKSIRMRHRKHQSARPKPMLPARVQTSDGTRLLPHKAPPVTKRQPPAATTRPGCPGQPSSRTPASTATPE